MSEKVRIELVPLGTRVEVPKGSPLSDILAANGIEFPCGGTDLCGGCRVRVLDGVLAASIADRCVFDEQELAQGWRLACRAHADEDVRLEVGQWTTPVLADSSRLEGGRRAGLGIAVDLGTTTIAAQLLDLASGEVLALETALNPQCAYGADVMNRVYFALSNRALTPLIRDEVGRIAAALAGDRCAEIREIVLVGNTVMHHLFSDLDVEPLAHAPFLPVNPGEQAFTPAELGWPFPAECRIRFIRCLGSFVGSDILAGILAAGLTSGTGLCALIDLGTNGEIALGNRDRILCASAAAGPAFEAGSIRMGMRAAEGAIARVFLRGGSFECHVIGNRPARGICGSGVVDAVASGLEAGVIMTDGRLAGGARQLPLADPVALAQNDIRELQLAKSAIASGLRMLLSRWGARPDELKAVHLAGAFGNYVRIESAIRIGLLEIAPCRIQPAGNTALRGAKMLLLSPELEVPIPVEHVPLALEPEFQSIFIRCLSFPEMPTG